tara:strand:+ start:10929 stop:12299 length:1371 start_codon:yes stop_codon:yes gene_type:complete
MCKCCCVIKCFPVPGHAILKCGRFYLTYYNIFVLQTIFTVGFHFFDIGSDIAVLVDLNQTKSEYFSLCLMIILLPVIANHIKSLRTLRRGRSCACFFTYIKYTFFTVILQGGFLRDTYYNLKEGKKTRGFVETRIQESLLESAPESLFQLFILLKNISNYTYNQLQIYYFSITLSILNLVMSLVSYEIFLYSESRKIVFMRNPTRAVDYSIPFDISEKPIKANSRYIILLTFYRLTEVLSRVGLLACIGNIYDGYSIIWFLLGDLFCLYLFNSIKEILNCEIWYYICFPLFYESDQDDVPENDDYGNYIQENATIFLFLLVSRLKKLSVYSNFFSQIIAMDRDCFGENDFISNKSECISGIKYHFMSRYLNNTILSILIIYNLSVNTYSYSIFVISISSIVSYVLNMLFLSLILNYTLNYKSYQYIFKPIGCYKCICCCKNKENEIEEKHPDDIVI